MIVSFTPNPAVDKTLQVPGLVCGEQNRAVDSQFDPGGKGINASRMVHRLGFPTVAIAAIGGPMGRLLARTLEEEGVPGQFAWMRGETRLNVILMDPESGQSTRVWDRGPSADPDTAARLLHLVRLWTAGARVFVTGGTMLPGMAGDLHATAIRVAAQAGAKSILDADGEAFLRGLEGAPTLVKPNVRECEAVLGRKLTSERRIVAGARELMERGPEAVVVSMGRKGSILVERRGAVRAVPPQVRFRSAVGSGDSLVAGLAIALARGDDLVEGLRLGTAAGAATAAAPGTQLGEREDVERLVSKVRIETLRV